MFTDEERALVEQYLPLIEAEWRRIGIGDEDARWIFGGSDRRPTAESLIAELEDLRTLPTEYGVEAFCARCGFDYHATKLELLGPNSGAT